MADYTLSAKVTLDTSNFAAGAKQVQGDLNNMTNATGNMTKSVALGNVAAGLFSKGMGMISSSMGSAIKRIDTMKNFPIVMESLGYDANDAAKSIQKISNSLDGLPTSTDSIVSMTQMLAPMTKSLDEASDIALAMNNALLAGGKAADEQSRAMIQYTQMLSTGKVDMQSWKSMQQAMPGQLDQIAKSLLGATAKGNDLYAAMKEGEVSFDDFNNAVLKLNKQGLPGMKNFEEQARAATGGIGTAMDNLKNRIAKGLADILEGIGRERISDFINNLSSTIKTGLSGLSDFAGQAADKVFPILEKLVANLPKIAAAITAITGVKFAWNGFQTITGTLTKFGTSLGTTAAKFSDFMANIALSGNSYGKFSGGLSDMAFKLSKISPLALGAASAIAGVAAALLIKDISDKIKYLNDYSAATEGIKNAALGATSELKDLNNALDVSDQLYTANAKSITELSDSGAKVAQSMIDRNTAVADSNALLDLYMDTIKELNGQFSSTEEDGARLKMAVQELNEALGTEYTVEVDKEGRYRVMAGDAQAATSEIEKLIQMKQAEARADAYAENYKEAYQQKAEAAKTIADINKQIAEAQAEAAKPENAAYADEYAAKIAGLGAQLEIAQQEYDAAGEAADNAERLMSNAATAADEGASSYYRLAESNAIVSSTMAQNGLSLGEFVTSLEEAGITEQEFGALSEAEAGKFAAAYAHAKESGDDVTSALKGVKREINEVDKKDPNVEVSESGAEETKGKLDDTAEAASGIPSKRSVTVTANAAKAVSMLTSVANQIRYITGSHSFSLSGVVKAITGKQAAGGVFLGNPNIIPRHADGGILAQPTLTSVGWVGEAGAEAIIPLSNKTYIKPFAQTVAAEMGGVGGGNVYVTLAYNADSNAKQMASDLTREIKLRRALEAR